MRIHGQALVDVIPRLGIVGAPTVRPDTGRARHALAGAQNDTERLVVDEQWETGHAADLGKVRATRARL